LSESEIGHVHVGEIANVTVEALESKKFAAEVVSVPVLSTTESGVVDYDVTFQLEQTASGLKPGMSATAEVVVQQEEGVNVPTSAITGGSVTVVHDGKQTRKSVVTGLAGNSTTIIRSGLSAGEEVVLPSTGTGSSATGSSGGARSSGGSVGGGFGGGGFGGAGGLGGGGGPP
jgi:macrolide-specific efflux system membrane fusion protein